MTSYPIFLKMYPILRLRYRITLGLLLLVGFWLRLSSWQDDFYHIDEFASMVAALMVAQHGLPILPSGLFYTSGLSFSFLSGVFVAILGFNEQIARWPSVLISVFTIAIYYTVAKRLFNSKTVGILAAALAAVDGWSVMWGGRARMHTMAHLFVLLVLGWLLDGIIKQPSRRSRYLFLLFLATAISAHLITIFIIPVLVILIVCFGLTYRHDWLRDSNFQKEGLGLLIVLGLGAGIVLLGRPDSYISLQYSSAQPTDLPLVRVIRAFLMPSLSWTRFQVLIEFFQESVYSILFPIVAGTVLFSFYRMLRRKVAPFDAMILFFTFLIALIAIEFGAVVAPSWVRARYLFIVAWPAFLLISAASLTWGAKILAKLVLGYRDKVIYQKYLTSGFTFVIVGMILFWGTTHIKLPSVEKDINFNLKYDQALTFVQENWQPTDKIISVHPPVTYLYLGRSDYYANQITAKVLQDPDFGDSYVDFWVGSPLIDSVESFNDVLANNQRVWFVIDIKRLFERYDPFFTQQIFAQMDYVYQSGETYVFLSHSQPVAIPAEPMISLDGSFDNLISLEGYGLDPGKIIPEGVAQLGLYWRPLAPTPARRVLKVFVQLRDNQNQIVSQADHFIFEGLLTASPEASQEWVQLYESGEWLRDTADLHLPFPLPPEAGPYRIYVGLYDPHTFVRLPLLQDSSGENAVIIDLPTYPQHN